MNNQKPAMFTPALVGGVVAGILSGVPLLNCLCCLWIIGGAILASYLLAKDSPVALTAGDGAILGVLTGIIAAVVDTLVSIPFHALNSEIMRRIWEKVGEYAEDVPAGWEQWLERGTAEFTFSMFMLGLVVSAFIFAALGALGGILGISLFSKKPPAAPTGTNTQTQTQAALPKDMGDSQP